MSLRKWYIMAAVLVCLVVRWTRALQPLVPPVSVQSAPRPSDVIDDKNSSSSSSSIDGPLSIGCVTWNFAEKCPGEHDVEFLKSLRGKDLIVLGVQECEDIKPRRHEGHRSRAWRALQKKALGKQYKCIAQHKMGGLQMAVYATKRASKQIKGSQVLDVACGVGNVLTNKGGICVLLRIKGKTVALLNGHFAAHQHKIAERNADFHRILKSVTARAPQRWLVRELAAKRRKASKAAKANGGEPWLEQVFQFAGMPEDKGFAERVRPVQLAPRGLRLLDGVGGNDEEREEEVQGRRKKRKAVPRKRKASGKAKKVASVLGFKLPNSSTGGPIVPSKRSKREAASRSGKAASLRSSSARRAGSDGDDSDDEEDEESKRKGGAGESIAADLPSLINALSDKLPDPFALKKKSKSAGGTSSSSSSSLSLVGEGGHSRNVHAALEDVPFDAVIFLGDFNYRVDLPRLEVELFKETFFPSARAAFPTSQASEPVGADVLPRLRQLFAFDQLERERRLGRIFKGFREGNVAFLPTFKYDKGSARFDSSPKARCPAWTDRILFAVAGGETAKTKLALQDYFSIDCRHSDHRPVGAVLELSL